MTDPMPRRPSLRHDRRGVTALEYGLILALIGLAIAFSITTIGTNITKTLGTVSTTLTR